MLQQQLIAGDTLSFVTAAPGYPASSGWTLKFRLVPRAAGGTPIELGSVPEGDDHRTQVTALLTAGYAAGEYGWWSWVEKGAEKYSLQSGQITIQPDPRTAAAGVDLRSLAQKALADARAALAAWQPTKRRYRIGDREMEFNSTADIITLITYWEGQVLAEDVAAGRTEKIGRRIYTRI